MNGDLKARLATAAVALPLLGLLVGWGAPWLFSLTFLGLSLAALREYFTMVCPADRWQRCSGIFFGAAISLIVLTAPASVAGLSLSLLLVGYFIVALFSPGSLTERFNRMSWTLLGGFYIGYLAPQSALLFELKDGRAWVAFLFVVVMAGDSAAYFVGKRFGRTKLAPQLSPGKTVEGAIGYVAGSLFMGLVSAAVLRLPLATLEIALLALIMSLLGQAGDLFESWIKRVFAVKDASELLPGHGGVLDRLDSLIFPAVFATSYLKVFHP